MVTDLSFRFVLFGLLDVFLFMLLFSLDQLYTSSAMKHAQQRITNRLLQSILIDPLIGIDALHHAFARIRYMPTSTSASTPTPSTKPNSRMNYMNIILPI